MTIGEALKQTRLRAGLTQKEMAAGIITPSAYSKIERGVHSVDAEVLISILSEHHFDVTGFFAQFNFQTSKEEPNFELLNQISFAQNKKDLEALDKISAQVKKYGKIPFNIEFRLQDAYAWVLHSNKMVTPEMKKKIKSLILNKEWDRPTYHYLSQAIILLDIDDAYYYVDSAFKAFHKNKIQDTFTLQFVALIAVNFLNCCYHQHASNAYAKRAIDFLRSLPLDPVIGFYSIIATYYEALFDNDQETKDMVVKILKKCGYLPLIQDTLD